MPEPSEQDAARPGVWVILPTYNEAENLERLVAAIRERLPEVSRVLVVDDNSPDGTGRDRRPAGAPSTTTSRCCTARGRRASAPPTSPGFREALAGGAELIVEMDADFSHDPAYLPQLLRAAEDADLVIGSRYVPGGGVTEWGPLRRFISRGGSAYARTALGLDVRDLTGGFKVIRREVLEAIDLDAIDSLGYAFQVEVTYRAIRAGFRVVEIPIVFRDRREGSSKMTKAIVAEAMWRVPAMRLRR